MGGMKGGLLRSAAARCAMGAARAFALALAAMLTLGEGVGRAAPGTPPPDFSDPLPAPITAETAPRSLAAQRGMIRVPAGVYPIGRDDGPAVEAPRHELALEAFFIDRTEVTNAAFAEYLNALGLTMVADFGPGALRARHARGAALALLREEAPGPAVYPIIALDDAEARIIGRGGRLEAAPGYEVHPVAETTWAGARAYCRWRGARLPTEAEWEAAARGPEGRLYPWGAAAPDQTRAFVSRRTAETAPVGERPAGASPFGALDMAGSMAEWTASLKRPYPYDAGDGREAPDAPGERVSRGGDYRFDVEPETLTATHRDGFSNAPERGHRHIGFRCAANAE
ncbi:MAG: SUMF1/EgtB/PvdO family nonheme iron enzyme [Pseudomonadota bacterium]